jgi:hypothetical protein
MTKITIAHLIATHNEIASTLNVKHLREKSSLTRAQINARIDEMRAQIDASNDVVALTTLCVKYNKNAKSIRARFRALYRDTNNNDLPTRVNNSWTFRACDVSRIIAHVTR